LVTWVRSAPTTVEPRGRSPLAVRLQHQRNTAC